MTKPPTERDRQPSADEPLVYGTPRARAVLIATVLGSGLAQLDGTVVTVALPRIGENLGAGLTGLQWTVNAYTLVLSGLLLLGGSLGDRLGRRRIYVLGVVWFTLASAGCSLAPDAGTLIAMRALQGAGAALLTPGSLAILQASFRPEDRSTAVGAWSGLGGVATAIGPLVGGLLVGVAPWGWRLVFLINVPLAAVVIVLARRYIPESRDPEATGRLDYPGAVLACLGLAGVVYGLTEGPATGWAAPATVALVAGLAVLAVFLLVEARSSSPLLPLGLFRSPVFAATNGVTLVLYAALAGILFLLPVQLQLVAGFSPVAAGVATLPITVVMLLLSARMGRLAQRIGPRLPMTIGPLLAGAAMLWLSRIDADSTYLGAVLVPMLLFGLGLSFTVAPLTSTVLAAAPEHQVGVASAINNDVARVAALLAVAVLPGLAGLGPAASTDPALFSAGYGRAVLIAGGLCALGGALALLTVPGRAGRHAGAGVQGMDGDATGPESPTDPRSTDAVVGGVPAGDPALDCPACPVTSPHIRPR